MRTAVSVCMATYNAGAYLRPQLDSILSELLPGDELVIVDDASTDGTVEQLRERRDRRLRLHLNPSRLGAPQTFARAIALAANPILLLADQDDVWIPGRVDALVQTLEESGAQLVSSNAEFIDATGSPIAFPMPPLFHGDSRRPIRNIRRIYTGRAGYQGCAMAFTASFRELVLPIPQYVEAHDLWIAMAANLTRCNVHLEQATLRRRIHGGNASVIRRPLVRKLWARAKFTLGALELLGRRLSRKGFRNA